MIVSEKLDAFFTEKMTEYPTQRSFLVPMLLYTQDEVGYLSDEAIAYVAQKVNLSELEIRNVISYYSMLTMKPKGKVTVGICRNICCMLRGADEIIAHTRQKLKVGHKGTTDDGVFMFEEVECIGACSWGPAMQVGYDFHEELTPEKVDEILEQYAKHG
ncbi:MAG: NADH-quinone oxidoreductase subunit NuoE [Terriglobales bacterium]